MTLYIVTTPPQHSASALSLAAQQIINKAPTRSARHRDRGGRSCQANHRLRITPTPDPQDHTWHMVKSKRPRTCYYCSLPRIAPLAGSGLFLCRLAGGPIHSLPCPRKERLLFGQQLLRSPAREKRERAARSAPRLASPRPRGPPASAWARVWMARSCARPSFQHAVNGSNLGMEPQPCARRTLRTV